MTTPPNPRDRAPGRARAGGALGGSGRPRSAGAAAPATLPRPASTEPEASGSEHRRRLLQGMARAVEAKGYAEATIADVVAEAAVSRRTFYEHFATKAECLIALYESASLQGLEVLGREIDPNLPWPEQVERALAAYLGWMARNPLLMRTLFVDILALGPEGLAARRRVHEQVASFILKTVDRPEARQAAAGGRGGRGRAARAGTAATAAPASSTPLPRELSLALVGGIHELVLEQIERGQAARLAALAPLAARLVRAVLSA